MRFFALPNLIFLHRSVVSSSPPQGDKIALKLGFGVCNGRGAQQSGIKHYNNKLTVKSPPASRRDNGGREDKK